MKVCLYAGLFLCCASAVFAEPTNKVAAVIDAAGETVYYDSLTQAVEAVQSGGTVYVYSGTHPVIPGYSYTNSDGSSSAPMRLVDKTDIEIVGVGRNAEIAGSGPGDFLFIRNCDNVRVKNLTFAGNKPSYPAGILFSMIYLGGTNANLEFEDCRFLNFGDHAISHLKGDKTTVSTVVKDCYFYNGGDVNGGVMPDGAAVSGIGSEWIISYNRVDSCLRGFEIENSGATAIRNVTISDNVLVDTIDRAIMIFATSHNSTKFTDILIKNNQIRDTLKTVNANAIAILIGGGENITVNGNLIRTCSGAGVYATAQFAAIKNLIISDNQIYDCGWRGIQVYDLTYDLDNALIADNLVSDCRNSGILVYGNHITVSGNHCWNNSGLAGHTGAGIQADAGGQNLILDNNRCWDDQATATQEYGLWVRSGVTDTIIRDNWLADNFTADVQDDGTGSVLFGNVTSEPDTPVQMEISLAGGNIGLYWPLSDKTYTLQAASNSVPFVWGSTTSTVSVVGDQYFTTMPSAYDGLIYRVKQD